MEFLNRKAEAVYQKAGEAGDTDNGGYICSSCEYTEWDEWVLVCTVEEHSHSDACRTPDIWALWKKENADMIVFASPLYFWTITSKLKAFIERFYCLEQEDENLPLGRLSLIISLLL